MAKNTEIEFKNLLTQAEYQQLLTHYSFKETDLKEQTNIYFDTADGQLRQSKQGLRIRLLTDSIELTLKTPTDDTYTYLETTDYLKSFQPEKSLLEQDFSSNSQVIKHLTNQNISVDSLKEIGSLTTLRGEKNLSSKALLVLDKSTYYGITDYELEMEVTDSKEGSLIFNDFLKTNKLPVRPAEKKIARMFQRKQQVMA